MGKEDIVVGSAATQAEVSNLITLMQKKMRISDVDMQLYLLEHTASIARTIKFFYKREDV